MSALSNSAKLSSGDAVIAFVNGLGGTPLIELYGIYHEVSRYLSGRDARITSNTSTTIVAGNIVQLVPFNQFSWWNKYQITPVWAASVGVIYFSDSFASSDDSVKLPGFFRVDGAVFAKINETWRAQINIENIFNKGYWASADGNNNISPGAPRTVRVALIAKF